MSTVDNNGNVHGNDGRFQEKQAGESTSVSLDGTKVPTVSPPMETHDLAYGAEVIATKYAKMLEFTDRVDDLLADLDVGPNARYLDIHAYTSIDTDVYVRDENGNVLDSCSVEHLATDIPDFGPGHAMPKVPAEFCSPDSVLGYADIDPSRAVVDLHLLRDFDWEAREQRFRDEMAKQLGFV